MNFSFNFKIFKEFLFIEIHEAFKELVLFYFDRNLYERIHFFYVTLLKISPSEIRSKGELIFQSISFIRIGSDLSGLVIEDKEETGIDIIFVEVNTLKLIPEISLIANKIPAKFFLVEIEVGKMLIVSSFDGLEILFGLHFLFFGEG